MKPAIRLDQLRSLISSTIACWIKAHDVPSVCVRLGVQQSIGEGDAREAFGSKATYVGKRLACLGESELVRVAQQVVREFDAPDVEDALELLTQDDQTRISQVVRAEVIRYLTGLDHPFGVRDPFKTLEKVLGGTTQRLEQHSFDHILQMRKTSGYVLSLCELEDVPQSRFIAVIEAVLHPASHQGEPQDRIATALNRMLVRDGFEARPTGAEGGRPVYKVVRALRGVAGTAKNIIFATIGEKPDLVFRDATSPPVDTGPPWRPEVPPSTRPSDGLLA